MQYDSFKVQNIQYLNASPLTGIFVNFLVVIKAEIGLVPNIITKLNEVNAALGTEKDQAGTSLDFQPGIISGKCNISIFLKVSSLELLQSE